jgi:hypothetical protein
MKGELLQKINKVECGIMNLKNSSENGSHWAAYYKNNDKNIILTLSETLLLLQKNLLNTLVQKKVYYNSKKIQNYNVLPIFGHLCLTVLQKLSKDENYEEILEELLKVNLKSYSI